MRVRKELLGEELREKVSLLKLIAPLVLVLVVLISTAYVLLTLALLSLIAMAFQPSPYRWFFSLLIVGISWAILGAVAGMFAWQRVSRGSLLPQKTINVLKADKAWLENEVKKTNEHRPDPTVGKGGLRAA